MSTFLPYGNFLFYLPDLELNKSNSWFNERPKTSYVPIQLSGKLGKLGYENIKTQDINFLIRNKHNNSFLKNHEIFTNTTARNKGVS